MRCPKCGYNQFDHEDTCSKCRADLSGERNRLNLPEGPLNPISLTEILKKVQSGSAVAAPAEGGTAKIQPVNPSAPKTLSLDLSDETIVSALSDKWKTNPEEGKKRPSEGVSVDLTLE
jgi:hypothetical protein